MLFSHIGPPSRIAWQEGMPHQQLHNEQVLEGMQLQLLDKWGNVSKLNKQETNYFFRVSSSSIYPRSIPIPYNIYSYRI